MPLLDVYDVTKTLKLFLEKRFAESTAWPHTLLVLPQPPDRLTGDNTLGLYLYHISENGHRKNVPPPGREQPPVRYTPMGLDLYYQLTPHSDLADEFGPAREQLMMSVALKALHDWPMIDSTTVLSGPNPLSTDDRVRIVLQPIPHDQVVSFWTAGSSPMRLSAYYQVSVVLLEPEESRTRTGRVLTYGVHTFVIGTPRLDSSENVLTFSMDPTVPEPQRVVARPAQVPLGSTLTFKGTNLTGDRTLLVLRTRSWTREGVVNDPAWAVTAGADQLTATIQPAVTLVDRAETTFPGTYTAQVRVVRRRTLPDGSVRSFEFPSNETPFLVSARLDGADVIPADAAGNASINGYGFGLPGLPAGAVAVFVGETILTPGTSGGLAPGEYAIVNGTDPENLEVRLPSSVAPGSLVPLRVIVNGAESSPKWIQKP